MKRSLTVFVGGLLIQLILIVGAGCYRETDQTKARTSPESRSTADASSVAGKGKILHDFEANVICVEGRKFVVFVGFRFGETVMTAVQIWDKNKFINAYPPQPEDCL